MSDMQRATCTLEKVLQSDIPELGIAPAKHLSICYQKFQFSAQKCTEQLKKGSA